MSIPNLPTDNLYKFLAVSGLVFALGCFYLAYKTESELTKGVWRLRDAVAILEARTELDLQDLEYLREVTDLPSRDNSDLPLNALADGGSRQEPDEGASVYLLAWDRVKQLDTEVREVKKELASRKVEASNLRFNSIVGTCLVLIFVGAGSIGLAVSAKGFSLWYHRMQKPLDELLQKRLAEQVAGQVVRDQPNDET